MPCFYNLCALLCRDLDQKLAYGYHGPPIIFAYWTLCFGKLLFASYILYKIIQFSNQITSMKNDLLKFYAL